MKEWLKKDADALAKIHAAVSDSIFPRIMNSTSAKQAWETLRDEFQGTAKVRAVRVQSLRRDFENLRMKEGESIKNFSSRVIELVNQMKAYGKEITKQTVIEKIMNSLTEKFDSVVSIIEESKDLSQLTELMGSLQAYEQRISRRFEATREGAFPSQHKNRFSTKGKRFNKGKSGASSSKEGEYQNKFPPCGVCKKTSHLEKNCWQKGKP